MDQQLRAPMEHLILDSLLLLQALIPVHPVNQVDHPVPVQQVDLIQDHHSHKQVTHTQLKLVKQTL